MPLGDTNITRPSLNAPSLFTEFTIPLIFIVLSTILTKVDTSLPSMLNIKLAISPSLRLKSLYFLNPTSPLTAVGSILKIPSFPVTPVIWVAATCKQNDCCKKKQNVNADATAFLLADLT